jgi:TonB family protein
MYRHRLSIALGFILLASCTQTALKASDNTSQAAVDAHKRQIVADRMAHLPPNHPGAEDISYNSHYPPHFPRAAMVAGHYGSVVLMLYVDAQGDIVQIRMEQSSGYPELDASAVEAAKQWLFLPAAKDGVPQPGWVRTPVNFDRPMKMKPPASTDSLRLGVTTVANARALLGEPGGVMRYTSGVTDMMWGNKSVGMAILSFDATGKLTKISRTGPG